jgi:hypothetical protein
MRTWTFEVTIQQGDDEFWEGYTDETYAGTAPPRGYATNEEVTELVKQALNFIHTDFEVELTAQTYRKD